MTSINYFLDNVSFFCPAKKQNEVLRELIKNGIAFHHLKSTEEGIDFSVSSSEAKKHSEIFDNCNEKGHAGLIVYLKKRRRRIGLLLGVILCILSLNLSSKFVWAVEAYDTGELSGEEIKELLEQAGLGVGTYIPTLDTELVCIKVLMNTEYLSYITVNIDGNVARVISAERKENEIDKNSTAPSNLIANEDGQIIRQELYSGMLVHKNGDIIRKGDLLISGLYESPRLGVKAVRASGKVYAEVSRSFEVFYPRTVYEKTYTGEESKGVELGIFGAGITVSECKEKELYDDEVVTENVTVFGTVKLPIVVKTTKRREYTYVMRTFDEKETLTRAMEEYEQKLAEISEDGELTEKSYKVISDETGCRITCSICLVRDITSEVVISQNK